MVSLSVLAAFGAMFCWAFGDFFIQRTVRRVGSVETLFWVGLFGVVALLPAVFGELAQLSAADLTVLMAVLGIVSLVVALLNFEALREGKLAVVDVLFEIELPVTVLLGVFFLGEILLPVHWIMIGAIFLGILLVSAESVSKDHLLPKFEKGAVLGIVGALGMGVLNYLTALGSRAISPAMAIWAPALVFTLACVLILIYQKRFFQLGTDFQKNAKWIVATSVVDTMAWLLFAIALVDGAVSITTAITEAYPALAMMLGVALNKEKIVTHQYAGALLAIIASIYLGFWA